MSDAKQYAERDIIAQGDYYTRHISAMTGEDLNSKSDIAAELAHRDMEIDRLRSMLNVRDRLNSEKNVQNAKLAADRQRTRIERDVAYQALRDILHPVQYLERQAAAEGTKLAQNAASVIRDPAFLQSIAEEALIGSANDINVLWASQIRIKEISDIIDAISSNENAAHIVVLLRERLGRARNVPNARATSDLETLLFNVRMQERTELGIALYVLLTTFMRNCKYITDEALADLMDNVVPGVKRALHRPAVDSEEEV